MKSKPNIAVEPIDHNGLWLACTTDREDVITYIARTKQAAVRGVRKQLKREAVDGK